MPVFAPILEESRRLSLCRQVRHSHNLARGASSQGSSSAARLGAQRRKGARWTINRSWCAACPPAALCGEPGAWPLHLLRSIRLKVVSPAGDYDWRDGTLSLPGGTVLEGAEGAAFTSRLVLDSTAPGESGGAPAAPGEVDPLVPRCRRHSATHLPPPPAVSAAPRRSRPPRRPLPPAHARAAAALRFSFCFTRRPRARCAECRRGGADTPAASGQTAARGPSLPAR
jgi:hypothetical protein